MEIAKGSHCRYQIRYHLVWKVKYSRKLLFGARLAYLKKIIYDIAERYDYTIEAVGIDDNHVHVFAGAHPAIAPAKLIQTIKSITARELFSAYPDIKKYLWGGSLWAIGYYVRTVSDGPIDKVVKDYINKQGLTKEPTKEGYQLKLVP
jgi:putative transposase